MTAPESAPLTKEQLESTAVTSRVVPSEATEEMLLACAKAFQHARYDESDKFRDWRIAFHDAIAAAPPLPADIEDALECAREILALPNVSNTSYERQLARALLKVCGRE